MSLQTVDVKGTELEKRIRKSFEVMSSGHYLPDQVFSPADYDWPGDKEGRALLALVCLYRAEGRMPPYLKEIWENVPEHLNEKGYFGPVHVGCWAEQQIAGHSWYLRALCAYQETFPKARKVAIDRLEKVVEHLYLPLLDALDQYPAEGERFTWDGKMIGASRRDLSDSGWICSTDVGCLSVALDGLTAAYEVLHRDDLKVLIEKWMDLYFRLPFERCHVQTHAMLSGLRGVLRYSKQPGCEGWGEKAAQCFERYLRSGMTLNDANQNWFGVPAWTESCAIIDSYLVAVGLLERTGDARYAEILNRIYYNAIRFSQRSTGAFGCDSCVMPEGDRILKVNAYDAHWCCTMRGGEFVWECVHHLFVERENHLVELLTPHPVGIRAFEGKVALRVSGGFPFDEEKTVTVTRNTLGLVRIRMFTFGIDHTETATQGKVIREENSLIWEGELREGDRLTVHFLTRVEKHNPSGNPYYTYGILLLGRTSDPGRTDVEFELEGERWCPVLNQLERSEEEGCAVCQDFSVPKAASLS